MLSPKIGKLIALFCLLDKKKLSSCGWGGLFEETEAWVKAEQLGYYILSVRQAPPSAAMEMGIIEHFFFFFFSQKKNTKQKTIVYNILIK